MVIKVGNRTIKIERCPTDSKLTTLQIEHSGSLQVVNLDKAETAAVLAALKVEAPKG
jgi:hypothetical protein